MVFTTTTIYIYTTVHTEVWHCLLLSCEFSVFAVPDYQLISLSYYTHTIVWDVVTGKANVSVYVNVTSHWTSLAVLKRFRGKLHLGRNGASYSLPVVTVVVGLSVVLAFMCTLQLISLRYS